MLPFFSCAKVGAASGQLSLQPFLLVGQFLHFAAVGFLLFGVGRGEGEGGEACGDAVELGEVGGQFGMAASQALVCVVAS